MIYNTKQYQTMLQFICPFSEAAQALPAAHCGLLRFYRLRTKPRLLELGLHFLLGSPKCVESLESRGIFPRYYNLNKVLWFAMFLCGYSSTSALFCLPCFCMQNIDGDFSGWNSLHLGQSEGLWFEHLPSPSTPIDRLLAVVCGLVYGATWKICQAHCVWGVLED